MDYILMNKDAPYALFSCEQDEFGEEHAVLREWYTDLRPISLRSLTAWLENARHPSTASTLNRFWSNKVVSVWKASFV